jgi:hypothetical protein
MHKDSYIISFFEWLTDSMQQGLSWEATASEIGKKNSPQFTIPGGSVPCSQEPHTCHCRAPDESSLFSPSCFFRIHLMYVILPSSLGFPRYFIPLVFPPKTSYALLFSLLIHTCDMSFTFHSLWVKNPNNNKKKYKLWCSLLCIFSVTCYYLPLRSKYLAQHPILKHIYIN